MQSPTNVIVSEKQVILLHYSYLRHQKEERDAIGLSTHQLLTVCTWGHYYWKSTILDVDSMVNFNLKQNYHCINILVQQ